MKHGNIAIGVVGVGHLGQYHVKHLKSLARVDLKGIYDNNLKRSKEISDQYKTPSFNKLSELLNICDAICIVTPTKHHFEVAKKAINDHNCHLFIEKPITKTIEEADELIKLAKKQNKIIQVGHIERLNPAVNILKSFNISPKFIEIQRLAPYTIRGTDVPVVLDLMIHDIDILLSLVKSDVKTIDASGVSILTDSIDIAHARIEFKNGTTASVTSSRVAKDKVRKIKIFQNNIYATLDLLLEQTEIYSIVSKKDLITEALKVKSFNYNGDKKYIAYQKPILKKNDLLKLELNNFIKSINKIEKPIVNGLEARNALKIATEIQNMIVGKLN